MERPSDPGSDRNILRSVTILPGEKDTGRQSRTAGDKLAGCLHMAHLLVAECAILHLFDALLFFGIVCFLL